MRKKGIIDFSPYKRFKEGQRSIDEFEELTDLAYGVTQQLLFRYPKGKLVDIQLPSVHHEKLSYSMGDQEVGSVRLSCEWVPLAEYARRVNLPFEEALKEASEGRLGPVKRHLETGVEVVVWPPEAQSLPLGKLPQLGKKTFAVQLAITARTPLDMDIENQESRARPGGSRYMGS